MKPIYMVGGSKGGVGKSMVTMALIDFLQDKNNALTIIETDTANPDVSKIFSEQINTKLLDLDTADGWIQLVNTCDERKDDVIVINTAARNNTGVEKYGETLRGTLADLNRELITLWVINRQRDSLELLRSFLNTFKSAAQVHVVRNNYFGCEEKFELYNGSKTKDLIESAGGKSLNFPDLADRVSDDLYTNRLSIKLALETLPIGNKAELRRWLQLVSEMFSQIYVE